MRSGSYEAPIVEKISPSPRLYTAPTWFVALFAAAVAVAIFAASTAAELYLYANRASSLAMISVSNGLSGVLAGYIALRLVLFARKRRASLRNRLQLVSDMNHRIRNALGIIQFSAYTSQNADTIRQINEAVNRIDIALEGLVIVEHAED